MRLFGENPKPFPRPILVGARDEHPRLTPQQPGEEPARIPSRVGRRVLSKSDEREPTSIAGRGQPGSAGFGVQAAQPRCVAQILRSDVAQPISPSSSCSLPDTTRPACGGFLVSVLP